MILILLSGIILGGIFNFLVYLVTIEEFISEEEVEKMSNLDMMKFSIKKIRINLKVLVLTCITTSFIFVTLALKYGIEYQFYKFSFLFSILIIATIIDYKTRSVYIIVSIVGIIGGIMFSTINIVVFDSNVLNEIISMFIPIVILGILKAVSRKIDGFGGGDIEMFIFIALYLSVIGTVVTLILSFILAGIISGISMLLKSKDKDIAFVPYITVATYITVILGEQIFQSYMKFI